MLGTMLLIGIATAFNFINIIIKWRRDRRADAIFDLAISAAMAAIFAGSMAGMAIAMVSSFFFSLYLWIYPIRLPQWRISRRAARITAAILFGLLVMAGNTLALAYILG